MFYFSSEVVDKKIEEFLSSFEEKIENLTEDAFNTQVIVLAWSFVGSPKALDRRRYWHPTPVLLLGNPMDGGACSPWGRWESDTTE